jgi:hypothetical protein
VIHALVHVFGWLLNNLHVHMDVSPVNTYKAMKHMKPSNLGLCFNGTMNFVLGAQYTNLNRRWLARILYLVAFDGFHNVWSSRVAFDHLPESLSIILACLKGTPVGTGEHVLNIFLLLFTVGALLGMIGFVIVVIDKFGSLRSKIEPVVNELRPIDSLFRLGTSRNHFKWVPGNVAPLLECFNTWFEDNHDEYQRQFLHVFD